MGPSFGDFRPNKEKAKEKSVGLQQEQAWVPRTNIKASPVGAGQDFPAKPAPGGVAW